MKLVDETFQPAPFYVERRKYVGQINIPDGEIDITDPCYAQDTWCAMFGHKVKAGKYNCYIVIINFPSLFELTKEEEALYDPENKTEHGYWMDDERIMVLEIVHEDAKEELSYHLINNSIGVDAGLCGFYNHKPDYEEQEKWLQFCDNLKKLSNGCTCDCQENGITVSSGFGDGEYMLFEAANKSGEPIALKLMFDEDQEGEESYED